MLTSPHQPVHVGVGIDTARYGHHVSFLNAQRGQAARDLAIAESAQGYQQLKQQLDKLHQKFPDVHFHVRIDAGGQYASNLEQFLRGLELPLTLSIGEPKRNKDYHRAMSPKRKSDASESLAIARFAVVEQPAATPVNDPAFEVMREIAGRLESQVKTTTAAVNRLHNLLSRVFPELATMATNVAATWVLCLLAKYPTGQRIARASLTSLEKIPYLSASKAQKIQDAASSSIGCLGHDVHGHDVHGHDVDCMQGDLIESLVQEAVTEVKHAKQQEKRLEKLLHTAFDALGESGCKQLETIVGIGKTTAAVLACKIVSIERFETADDLVGYFGVFPEEYSSGVDRTGQPRQRRWHMSRKGNDLVRRYLFCAAKSAMRHNHAVRALYARLRARGTRGDVALGHCMRKLLHQVFGVWSSNQPFDQQYETKHKSDVQQTAEDSASSGAQQETAGPKKEVSLDRQEVTAATSNIDAADASVNSQSSPTDLDTTSTDTMSTPSTNKQGVGSIDYAYLRSQVTIEQVLRKMGHFDRLRGSVQLRGVCPFHDSPNPKSRSFSVNLHKNVFRCCNPECGMQGNALDLWAQHTGLCLYEAAVNLADMFHLELTPPGTEKRQPVKRPARQPVLTKTSGTTKAGVTTPDAT